MWTRSQVPSLTGITLSDFTLYVSNHPTSLDIQAVKPLRTSLDSCPIMIYRTLCPLHHPYTFPHGMYPPRPDLSWVHLLLDPKPPNSRDMQTWPMTLHRMAPTAFMAGTFPNRHADTMRMFQTYPRHRLNSLSVRGT